RDPAGFRGSVQPRGGARIRYTARVAAGARVTDVEITTGTDAAPERLRITLAGDSAAMQMGGAPAARVAVPPGTLPFLNLSAAFVEQIALRAVAMGGDSAHVPLLVGGMTLAATVRPGADGEKQVEVGGVLMRLRMDGTGRLDGACVPAQGVAFVRLHPAPARPFPCSAATQPAPDYSAPAGAPYGAVEVRIPTGRGYTLAGTLTLPKGEVGRVPAVVLVTGSGPEERDSRIPGVPGYAFFRQIADTLGRRGIAVLRVDDRGVGGSGGDPTRATTADFADDARAALAYLRTRAEIDPARVAIAGHSEGGMIAPMVASTDPAVRAVVLLAAPAWTGRRISLYQNRQSLAQAGITGAAADSVLRTVPARLDSAAAGQPWLRHYLDYDPLPSARRLRVPVLVLQGGSDHQVTPEQAEELARAMRDAGNARVTVRVFPDVDHLFLRDPAGTASVAHYAGLPSKQVPSEVLGAMADWLAATLR
ncbi:MAG TPA: alpha/beta fold hydrolase, partial [Longimicrobiaceae bacterium]|nr:alpha/beta fold hydrolase [Longimicrobiaceae bacterium]